MYWWGLTEDEVQDDHDRHGPGSGGEEEAYEVAEAGHGWAEGQEQEDDGLEALARGKGADVEDDVEDDEAP